MHHHQQHSLPNRSDPNAVVPVNLGQIEWMDIRCENSEESSFRDGFENISFHGRCVLHAPCLHTIWIQEPLNSTFATPLRIEAPRLRKFSFDAMNREALHVYEPGDERALVDHGTTALVLVTHSLFQLVIMSSILKDVHVHSSSLNRMQIRTLRARGWGMGGEPVRTLMLSTVRLFTPGLTMFEINAAMQDFVLHSFLLRSLDISPRLAFGGCPRPDEHPFGNTLTVYEYQDVLRSVNVSCPSIRSFKLLNCTTLRFMFVELRQPPRPAAGGAAAASAPWVAMATTLQELKVKGCEQLARMAFIGHPKGTFSPGTPPAALDRRPHREPLAALEVDDSPALRAVTVEGEGWRLARESVEALGVLVRRIQQRNKHREAMEG